MATTQLRQLVNLLIQAGDLPEWKDELQENIYADLRNVTTEREAFVLALRLNALDDIYDKIVGIAATSLPDDN